MVAVADGFLGRWSQRKQAVREGKVLEEPVIKPAAPAIPVPKEPLTVAAVPLEEAPPPPSMEDVKALTAESDFKPFVARDVTPEVRNAAMKKLFADPHYNVMDGLDIYIDDYSKPDPLPESMLRQMASAKFLKLFDDEPDATSTPPVRDDAHTIAGHSVAQSAPLSHSVNVQLTDNTPQPRGIDHDHTDLRLQPNHAAGPRDPGRGTE